MKREPDVLGAYERFKARIEGWRMRPRARRWPWCFPWHAWDRWRQVRGGSIKSGSRVIGHFVDLQRVCQRCGDLRVKHKEW